MVENAVAMVEHAQRDYASGNAQGALSWLEGASSLCSPTATWQRSSGHWRSVGR